MYVPDHPTKVYSRLWVGPHPDPFPRDPAFSLLVLTAFQHQALVPPPACDIYLCPLTDDAFEIVRGDQERCHKAAEEIVKVLRDPAALVLVTCSAGQNRSSWVAGRAMIMMGRKPTDVVATLERERGFVNWFFKQDLLKN